MRTALVLVFFHLFGVCSLHISAQTIDLKKQDWNLQNKTGNISVEHANPSDVHLSLMEAGQIPDPFYRLGEEKIQWVAQQDWVYSCSFFVPENMIETGNPKLIFEGMDTYANVFLNDSLVLSTDNMFVEWVVEIGSLIKPGYNKLKIEFVSPLIVNRLKAEQFKIRLPDNRGFTRKAAYHFGWDWGPGIVTMGIWKAARIEFGKEIETTDLFVEQKKVKDEKAEVKVMVEIVSEAKVKVEAKLEVDGLVCLKKVIKLKGGTNYFSFPMEIENPKLWWPNGMGEQNLYEITVSILMSGKVVDEKTAVAGLRSVEVIQEKDSVGKSFFFRVNGQDVFAKGANYIPQDNFLSRVSSGNYKQIIETAAKSNMNMLRVWGGGIYENDEF